MASITAEEVKESLSIFDIDVDVDSLEKMLEIATLFDYDADSLVNEWLAYQSTHGCALNVGNLEKLLLEKTVARNRGRNNQTPSANRKRNAYDIENTDNYMDSSMADDAEEDSLLTAYGTPCRPQNKNRRKSDSTPRSAIKSKADSFPTSTPTTMLSSSTLSPNTPSQKYGSRSNRGDIVARYGPSCTAISTHRGQGRPINITMENKEKFSNGYKYMFQKLVDLSEVMDDAIETVAEIIRQQNIEDIDAFTSCCVPSQEPVFVTGRICCDQGGGIGRLNSQSVLMQGSKLISGGKSVHVDLSQVEEYSLFPGQIVVMHGMNPTGRKFIPSKIFLLKPSLPKREVSSTSDALSLLIAAGPFTTTDSLSYEPLNDLIETARTTQPDVTFIIGPIVDNKHEDLRPDKMSHTYEDFLQDRLHYIIEALKGYSQVVFVPSNRDAGCHPVYPQPPYPSAIKAKDVHFGRDPCVLGIDGINVAITSNDILLHLGGEEISKVKGSSDRLGRLAGHVLQQRSFYPLCPSNESVNVDWIAAEQLGTIAKHPDLLILPSDLKGFVKQIEGCICINPGRLAKGLTGGTYAQVLFEPVEDENDSELGISAQIVKI